LSPLERPSPSRARLAHLGIAAFTLGVVYSPTFAAETVRELLRLLVLPGLVLSGSVLWYLRRRRVSSDDRTVGPAHPPMAPDAEGLRAETGRPT
jgi:hypothetical protein